jgi:hypothetical protein
MANLFLAVQALRIKAWFPKSVRDLILPRFPGHLDMRFNSSIEVLHEEQES